MCFKMIILKLMLIFNIVKAKLIMNRGQQMKCYFCENESAIFLEGAGGLCLACYNKWMMDLQGLDEENFNRHLRSFTIQDAHGKEHVFDLTYHVFRGRTIWTAKEQKGEYLFEEISLSHKQQGFAIRTLIEKAIQGVSCPTLRAHDDTYPVSNALQRQNKQYSLRSTGVLRVESEGSRTRFMIDGQPVSPEDLLRMLSIFEGFNIFYQAEDVSGQVLPEKSALQVVTVDFENIYRDFEEALLTCLKNDFVSYEIEFEIMYALSFPIDKWTFAANHGDRNEAKACAQKMKERLLSLGTDSDDFPITLIKQIEETENLLFL